MQRQRIGITTREGKNGRIRLERFGEALSDSSTGLTVPALTGERKQSITDVERLFGAGLLEWLKRKQYNAEAKYVEVIHNWHRATDERGLSELQRSRFNYEMLNYILDDLMPWYKVNYDLSLLEVNRYVDSINNACTHTPG